ncbi:MAG: hypothetical protein ABL917_02950 [Parcubacteria group bacterium]
MSIKETLEKIKPFYTLLLLIISGSVFFALGRLSVLESKHVPIKIEYPNSEQSATVIGASVPLKSAILGEGGVVQKDGPNSGGSVVGSKSGKKYYFPWCGTVKRIKPENQVNFSSIEEAKKAGFTPGGNCKGLK